jgi:molybdopterin-containing oxidoreductase family iron-sulfur binding subunit
MTSKPEAPGAAVSDPNAGVDRRQFLKVLGVTGAGTAALSGCSTDKVAKLVPYMVQSEQQVPGVATWYASTCTECSTGCGVHVKTREGRAIKLEGNPEHPVNGGSLCSRGQAGLQALYIQTGSARRWRATPPAVSMKSPGTTPSRDLRRDWAPPPDARWPSTAMVRRPSPACSMG